MGIHYEVADTYITIVISVTDQQKVFGIAHDYMITIQCAMRVDRDN